MEIEQEVPEEEAEGTEEPQGAVHVQVEQARQLPQVPQEPQVILAEVHMPANDDGSLFEDALQ